MRLLDLFCGAGGAAVGYHRAGFEVVGVDLEPQPHFPFEFHQADAMTYPLENFDVIHASPPCQGYSRMRNLPWLRNKSYPLLIEPTRQRLLATDCLWVIENVMDAHLPAGWLCGGMFGLSVYRHRAFETNFFWLQPAHPRHRRVIEAGRMLGGRLRRAHKDMKLDWMSSGELAEAIPPAYTEYIGRQLLKMLSSREEVANEVVTRSSQLADGSAAGAGDGPAPAQRKQVRS